MSVRLGVLDHTPGGTTLEEGVQFAKWCEQAGADLLNISCGFYTKGNQSIESQWEQEGSRLYMSEAVKKVVSIPVSIVGKLRTPEFCAEAIEQGKTDLVTIGRQLICDPQWPNKVLTGRTDTIRTCLDCCQGCMDEAFFKHGNIHCQINPYVGYEDLYRESSVAKAAETKKIAVIGGGIAGMQFAIIANKRGHEVTIFEKADKLGGQMILAGKPPFKQELVSALDWFRAEVQRSGIAVQLSTEATADAVTSAGFDIAVVAVGAEPTCPPIKGVETAVESWDILSDKIPVPEKARIAIIGGGVVGAELAHMLVDSGCDVTIIEMLPEICRGHQLLHKANLEEYLNQHAHIYLNAKVTEIGRDFVSFVDNSGADCRVEVDKVVTATGHRPVGENLYQALLASGMDTYKIGDCVSASNIRFATRGAFDLAYSV